MCVCLTGRLAAGRRAPTTTRGCLGDSPLGGGASMRKIQSRQSRAMQHRLPTWGARYQTARRSAARCVSAGDRRQRRLISTHKRRLSQPALGQAQPTWGVHSRLYMRGTQPHRPRHSEPSPLGAGSGRPRVDGEGRCNDDDADGGGQARSPRPQPRACWLLHEGPSSAAPKSERPHAAPWVEAAVPRPQHSAGGPADSCPCSRAAARSRAACRLPPMRR